MYLPERNKIGWFSDDSHVLHNEYTQIHKVKVKVKVKFSLERTTKTQWVSSGLALLFH